MHGCATYGIILHKENAKMGQLVGKYGDESGTFLHVSNDRRDCEGKA